MSDCKGIRRVNYLDHWMKEDLFIKYIQFILMRYITPLIAWNYDIDSLNSIDFHPTKSEIAVANADSTGEAVYLRVS